MTNKKITDFTTGPALTGNEFFPIAIGDKNYKYDLNFISTWFSGKPMAYNFGALADDPTVSPFDGGPIPLGAQYYNTTLNAIRAFGDGGWFTPNLDAAIFALATGAQLVGTPEGTVQDALYGRALLLPDQTALRAYEELATGVQVTQGAWFYQRDPSDTTSPDNGGTVIVDALGRRWKYLQDGPAVPIELFGAIPGGVVECGAAIQKALDFGGVLLLSSQYKTAQKLSGTQEGTRLIGSSAKWGSEVSSGSGFIADSTLNADFLLEFKNPSRPNHRSIGMEHVSIDCGTSSAGGLAVYGAYDSSNFEYINITNVPGNRIGFLASAGDPVTRSGVIQTAAFRSIWAIKRAGASTVPAIRTFGIQESEIANCKASHSSATVAAWEVVSCAGLALTGPSCVNPTGPGLDIIENHGSNDGVTISTPTFENCLGTIRTYTTDARMFGTITTPPAVGSIVQQPADGTAAKGTVWQSSGVGVYVKDVTGAFATGSLYDASGVFIGTVSSLALAGNNAIELMNPRVLGGATVGAAAGGSFKSLLNSRIDLPDDPVTAYLHVYTADDSVVNCMFAASRAGQMANPGKFNSFVGIADINVNFNGAGDPGWPWPTQTVRLTNFPRAKRVTITKSVEASFLSILPTTDTVNEFGSNEIRLFEGGVTFVRKGATAWAIEHCFGSAFVLNAASSPTQGVLRLSSYAKAKTYTAAATAVDTSTIDGAQATNAGAAATVNLNLAAVGVAVLIGTKFSMTRVANFAFRVTPNAADTILGASAAGKYLELGAVGSSVTLECIAANTYAVVASSGTFTFQP